MIDPVHLPRGLRAVVWTATVSVAVAMLAAGCGGASRTITITTSRTSTTLTATTAATATAPNGPVPASVIANVERYSIVPVTCVGDEMIFEGTAFAVARRLAVTASHFASKCDGGRLGNGEPNGVVVQTDPTHDLALVMLGPAGGFGSKAHALRRSPAPAHVGEQLALLGIARGTFGQVSVALGPVVATHARATLGVPAGRQRERLSDAIIVGSSGVAAGESGGPAIDADGDVVGVIEGSGMGFTILTPVTDLPPGV
jgi:S1-C subfamily serine protease